MHNSSHKKHSLETPSPAVQEAERRGAERHMFTAGAEVVELKSGARFSTRTTDLGPGGCFVDTTVPFPIGSIVRVTLNKGKVPFVTAGTVVYSQHGLGMGIAFSELDDEKRLELADWIAGVTGERPASHDIALAPKDSNPNKGRDFVALVRLVRLMIGKGILTEAEGSSVLHDPVL
ncbi:MAG TPA: PilZ domain-containing protein [Candidatus Acidoferrales bacterium]|nr:PilZ domain-containing protein [Candidatus Acidoferrales bacterium]